MWRGSRAYLCNPDQEIMAKVTLDNKAMKGQEVSGTNSWRGEQVITGRCGTFDWTSWARYPQVRTTTFETSGKLSWCQNLKNNRLMVYEDDLPCSEQSATDSDLGPFMLSSMVFVEPPYRYENVTAPEVQ